MLRARPFLVPTSASSLLTGTGTATLFPSTLTGSLELGGTASPSSSAIGPAPTANSTVSSGQQTVALWAPAGELVMCRSAEFAFTGPAVPKSCGVYVTNTSTYLQQISLGGDLTALTAGTFSWFVDLPAGLSVEVQFWVTLNHGVQQYTLHDLIVQPSDDDTCIATGAGQNTESIVSYASCLNSSWVFQQQPSGVEPAKGHGTPVGPIVGAVVGVSVLVVLILAFLLWRRRRSRRRALQPGVSPAGADADTFEKSGEMPSLWQAHEVAPEWQPGSPQSAVVPYHSPYPLPGQPVSLIKTGAPSFLGVPSEPATPVRLTGTSPSSPKSHVSSGGALGAGATGLDDPGTFSARRQS
ncbi:hypothetical protein JCM8202_002677 [Rhodotorula sphaerocarpa]